MLTRKMGRWLVGATLALALLGTAPASADELSGVSKERALRVAESGGVAVPSATVASVTTIGAVRGAIEGTPPVVLAGTADPAASSATQQQLADEPIEAVTMTGAFTLTTAKVPKGLPFPKGKYLTVGVDLATHHAAFVQLGNKRPMLPGVALTVPRGVRGTGTIARRVHRARAAWAGNGCSLYGEHCYSIAERPMSGGEMVVGTQANHLNEAMNVPEYWGFVDEEEWAIFDGVYWIETGQEAGDGYDCCSMRWFVAWNKKNVGYQQYINPPGDRWKGGNYNYQLHYTGPGAWGAEVGNVLVTSTSGLRTYSTWLQVGDEIATNNEPYVVGRHETNEWWTNWTAHNWGREHAFVNPHMCVQRNPWSNALGNIQTWTC